MLRGLDLRCRWNRREPASCVGRLKGAVDFCSAAELTRIPAVTFDLPPMQCHLSARDSIVRQLEVKNLKNGHFLHRSHALVTLALCPLSLGFFAGDGMPSFAIANDGWYLALEASILGKCCLSSEEKTPTPSRKEKGKGFIKD